MTNCKVVDGKRLLPNRGIPYVFIWSDWGKSRNPP